MIRRSGVEEGGESWDVVELEEWCCETGTPCDHALVKATQFLARKSRTSSSEVSERSVSSSSSSLLYLLSDTQTPPSPPILPPKKIWEAVSKLSSAYLFAYPNPEDAHEVYRRSVLMEAVPSDPGWTGSKEQFLEAPRVEKAKASLRAHALALATEWDFNLQTCPGKASLGIFLGPREFFKPLAPNGSYVMAIQRSLALEKARCLLILYTDPTQLLYISSSEEEDDPEIFLEVVFPDWDDIEIPPGLAGLSQPKHFGPSLSGLRASGGGLAPPASVSLDQPDNHLLSFEFDSTPWDRCTSAEWILESKRQHPFLGQESDGKVTDWIDFHIFATFRRWVLWDFYWTLKEGRRQVGDLIISSAEPEDFTAENCIFPPSLERMPLTFFVYLIRNYGLIGAKALDYERMLILREFGGWKEGRPAHPQKISKQVYKTWLSSWDGLSRVSALLQTLPFVGPPFLPPPFFLPLGPPLLPLPHSPLLLLLSRARARRRGGEGAPKGRRGGEKEKKKSYALKGRRKGGGGGRGRGRRRRF